MLNYQRVLNGNLSGTVYPATPIRPAPGSQLWGDAACEFHKRYTPSRRRESHGTCKFFTMRTRTTMENWWNLCIIIPGHDATHWRFCIGFPGIRWCSRMLCSFEGVFKEAHSFHSFLNWDSKSRIPIHLQPISTKYVIFQCTLMLAHQVNYWSVQDCDCLWDVHGYFIGHPKTSLPSRAASLPLEDTVNGEAGQWLYRCGKLPTGRF